MHLTSYINEFLQIKAKASVCPELIMSDPKKNHYLSEYEEKEGIQLEKEKVSINPGLRALVKLCSKSFLGRLGMRETKPVTKHITGPREFLYLMLSGELCVTSFDVLTNDVLQVCYRVEEVFI